MGRSPGVRGGLLCRSRAVRPAASAIPGFATLENSASKRSEARQKKSFFQQTGKKGGNFIQDDEATGPVHTSPKRNQGKRLSSLALRAGMGLICSPLAWVHFGAGFPASTSTRIGLVSVRLAGG
jgi:hypothetical protein